jgi:hypothetical protein
VKWWVRKFIGVPVINDTVGTPSRAMEATACVKMAKSKHGRLQGDYPTRQPESDHEGAACPSRTLTRDHHGLR